MSAPAQLFAANLMAALSELEVSEVFVAPGSRSQALAIAAGQLHDADRITLHVRIDERSMAFQALGAAKATGRPVALITTSGTAVANLHPAVLEANHSGVPLILLTADRPAELRGVGANQTTNQVGIFADAVRSCVDVPAPNGEVKAEEVWELARTAVSTALGLDGTAPGPVQLNICFREPLSASEPNAADIFPDIELPDETAFVPEFAVLDGSRNTVVVAGADSTLEALEIAEAFGWPIFAEPSSRARTGANAIAHYPELLKKETELASRIERVVVFGKPTLSRVVMKLIAREDIELIVIRSRNMGTFNPSGNATKTVDEISLEGEPSSEWLARWRVASLNWQTTQPKPLELDRRTVIEQVYEVTELDDVIVLGASRMVREADVWAPAKAVQVFSNRGLSGIDGTIATATGIALVAEGATVRCVLGDLTALHDVSSMLEDPEVPMNLQLIVVNDFGGTIFENLEVAETISRESFERLFKAGQKVDFWSLANAFGFSYALCENAGELANALSMPGRVLIEVRL